MSQASSSSSAKKIPQKVVLKRAPRRKPNSILTVRPEDTTVFDNEPRTREHEEHVIEKPPTIALDDVESGHIATSSDQFSVTSTTEEREGGKGTKRDKRPPGISGNPPGLEKLKKTREYEEPEDNTVPKPLRALLRESLAAHRMYLAEEKREEKKEATKWQTKEDEDRPRVADKRPGSMKKPRTQGDDGNRPLSFLEKVLLGQVTVSKGQLSRKVEERISHLIPGFNAGKLPAEKQHALKTLEEEFMGTVRKWEESKDFAQPEEPAQAASSSPVVNDDAPVQSSPPGSDEELIQLANELADEFEKQAAEIVRLKKSEAESLQLIGEATTRIEADASRIQRKKQESREAEQRLRAKNKKLEEENARMKAEAETARKAAELDNDEITRLIQDFGRMHEGALGEEEKTGVFVRLRKVVEQQEEQIQKYKQQAEELQARYDELTAELEKFKNPDVEDAIGEEEEVVLSEGEFDEEEGEEVQYEEEFQYDEDGEPEEEEIVFENDMGQEVADDEALPPLPDSPVPPPPAEEQPPPVQDDQPEPEPAPAPTPAPAPAPEPAPVTTVIDDPPPDRTHINEAYRRALGRFVREAEAYSRELRSEKLRHTRDMLLRSSDARANKAETYKNIELRVNAHLASAKAAQNELLAVMQQNPQIEPGDMVLIEDYGELVSARTYETSLEDYIEPGRSEEESLDMAVRHLTLRRNRVQFLYDEAVSLAENGHYHPAESKLKELKSTMGAMREDAEDLISIFTGSRSTESRLSGRVRESARALKELGHDFARLTRDFEPLLLEVTDIVTEIDTEKMLIVEQTRKKREMEDMLNFILANPDPEEQQRGFFSGSLSIINEEAQFRADSDYLTRQLDQARAAGRFNLRAEYDALAKLYEEREKRVQHHYDRAVQRVKEQRAQDFESEFGLARHVAGRYVRGTRDDPPQQRRFTATPQSSRAASSVQPTNSRPVETAS